MSKAPHCPCHDSPMQYTDGEMMTDSTYHCLHGGSFIREERGDWSELVVDGLRVRWTHRRYGDIPARTLTAGTSFSPYDNPRYTWFEPDFAHMDAVIASVRDQLKTRHDDATCGCPACVQRRALQRIHQGA